MEDYNENIKIFESNEDIGNNSKFRKRRFFI